MPPIQSMPSSSPAMMMAVPRSPSRMTKPQIARPTAPKGHMYEAKSPVRTRRCDSRCAPTSTTASLANLRRLESEGAKPDRAGGSTLAHARTGEREREAEALPPRPERPRRACATCDSRSGKDKQQGQTHHSRDPLRTNVDKLALVTADGFGHRHREHHAHPGDQENEAT